MATAALLGSRRLVRVAGPDAQTYLQGIITVDMRKLTEKQLVAGAFLNAKGRIMFDVLLSKQPSTTGNNDAVPTYDLEVSRSASDDLISMLGRFKLRKKVTITADDSRKVYAVWSSTQEEGMADPRPGHALGKRVWASECKNVQTMLDESAYHAVRMAAGIAEGPEECADELPFILNFDWWPNTLAFDKGCYTGQELVARTHFKGQVRKRIVPVLLSTQESQRNTEALKGLLPSWTSWKIEPTSKVVPAVKSTMELIPGVTSKMGEGTLIALAPAGMNHIGLAAFRDAQAVPPPGNSFEPTHQIKLDGGEVIKVCPIRPVWWPTVESV